MCFLRYGPDIHVQQTYRGNQEHTHRLPLKNLKRRKTRKQWFAPERESSDYWCADTIKLGYICLLGHLRSDVIAF